MLASIHPLGERGRGQRWAITVSAYLAGTVAGAALPGAVLGTVGSWVPGLPASAGAGVGLAVAALAVAGVALDLRLGGVGVPTVHRQVDEEWLGRYRGWVYGVGYGFQLGLGVVTVVSSFTVYLAFALALLTGSTLGGLAVGLTFGLVRGATILAAASVRDPGGLHRLHRRIAAWNPATSALAVGVQAVVAASGLALAIAR